MADFFYQRYKALANVLSVYFLAHPIRFVLIASSFGLASFGVYIAVWAGFSFLVGLGGLGSIIIKHLLYVMFFIVFFMIALSFAILYYTLSFRSKETKFLLTLPSDEKNISFLRFIESTILTGWIPLAGLTIFILAYSKINNLSFFIPLVSVTYLIPFMLIASSLGYLFCIFTLKFMNLKRLFIFTIILLIGILLSYKSGRTNNINVFYLLSEEIIFFKISKLWFMPFSWTPWVIIHMENGNIFRSCVFLINLWSLSLLSLSLIYSYGGKIFTSLFFKYSVPVHKRRYREGYLDRIFTSRIFPLNIGNFILKDIKLFIREPVLWLQFLIFFGLLFFYFINLQRFSYNLLEDIWKNLITFLNTFSVLCISSALTIRFVFPQWSLEGRSYWILKLSPLKVRDIFMAKFALSFSVLMFISLILIIISDKMLEVTPQVKRLTIIIIAISTFSLTSFSLGLGAYFADFKREYYLKAVESLGGFIALILNFGYVVITIFGFAFINHIFIIKNIAGTDKYIFWILSVWSILSIVLGFILLYIGINKLKEKEY